MRSFLAALAAAWFLIHMFGLDPELEGGARTLYMGLALIALALINWRPIVSEVLDLFESDTNDGARRPD